MSASEITKRHESKMLVGVLYDFPEADYDPNDRLGNSERKYVFVGDYDEQRYRTSRQILSNLWIGDAFERVENSNISLFCEECFIGYPHLTKFESLGTRRRLCPPIIPG